MRWRRSGSGRVLPAGVALLLLPSLLLLFLLHLSARRIPSSALELVSEEGTTIYFNTATVKNADVLFSGERPVFSERLRVADYLMRPVLMRFQIENRFIQSAVNHASAPLLEGLMSASQIRDLALLLTEGSTALTESSGQSPGRTLETTGFHGRIQSTISDTLQQSIGSVIRSELQVLRRQGAYQASIVVLERQGDHLRLRAMVDTGATHGWNGALLVRQAGSVLKPFIYSMAFDRFSVRPGDAVDDTPLRVVDGSEVYEPRNHDNQFVGRITVREALASSRNIPAVRMLQLVNTSEYASFLRDVGLEHIERPEHYGLSMALGTAGASVLETSMLFSILACEGKQLPLLIGTDGEPIFLTPAGRPVREERSAVRRFSPETALLITHVLSDRAARRISFGKRNFLDFPFDVAAKTGTSQSFRDSWTAGYTDRYVVAVWVGNYSGASMNAVSGLRGAARIFHQVIRLLVGSEHPTFRYPPDWKMRSGCRSGGDQGACNAVEELVLPGRGQASEEMPIEVQRLLLDASGSKALTLPMPGQVFYLDPHRSEGQSVPFEFRDRGRLSLLREGQPVPGFIERSVEAGRLLVDLKRGRYEMQFIDAKGRVMNRHFEVK